MKITIIALNFCNFNEKFSCINVTLSEYEAADNDFKICGKLNDKEIIKTITEKEPQKDN